MSLDPGQAGIEERQVNADQQKGAEQRRYCCGDLVWQRFFHSVRLLLDYTDGIPAMQILRHKHGIARQEPFHRIGIPEWGRAVKAFRRPALVTSKSDEGGGPAGPAPKGQRLKAQRCLGPPGLRWVTASNDVATPTGVVPQPLWGWSFPARLTQGSSRARNLGLQDRIPLGFSWGIRLVGGGRSFCRRTKRFFHGGLNQAVTWR